MSIVRDIIENDRTLQTNTEILDRVKTVDGINSGLDADLVRGLPADFTSSKATNGYQKLPSGLIIQWGLDSPFTLSSSSTTTHTVTFPITFPTSVLQTRCSKHIDNGGNAGKVSADILIGSETTSEIKIVYDNLSSTDKKVGGAWLAIGY